MWRVEHKQHAVIRGKRFAMHEPVVARCFGGSDFRMNDVIGYAQLRKRKFEGLCLRSCAPI